VTSAPEERVARTLEYGPEPRASGSGREPGQAWLAGRLSDLGGFASGAPGRVRLHTVSLTRWVAVIGQLFTILFVHFSLGISLPLMALLR
jgi:hypothetical protein